MADNKVELLLATENSGKKRELISFLADVNIEALLPSEIPGLLEYPNAFPPENGATFAENAFIKANFIFQKSHLPTLADDSGLSVISLGNFPGIRSARWLKGNSKDRNEGLLNKMEKVTDRSAFFTCVLCLILPSRSTPAYFEGIYQGTIAQKPAGTGGFGYDSIFIPDGETKTLAELGEEYKLRRSHRTIALQKLVKFLKENVVQ